MKDWNDTQAFEIIQQAKAGDQPLTTALRTLADEFGYIADAAIAPLAKAFSRSKAEVVGVISYYTDFRTQKPGKHILRICQAESCQAVGARALTDAAKQASGLALGETGGDGALTLEPVYCLGLCANGPAIEIDGQAKAEVDTEQIQTLIEGCKP